MPYLFASAAAFPGVGDATATTSAHSEAILKEAAWMSASNCEPMIPTFTFPFSGMGRVLGGQSAGEGVDVGCVQRKSLVVNLHSETPRLSFSVGRAHLPRRRSKPGTSRNPRLTFSTIVRPRTGSAGH